MLNSVAKYLWGSAGNESDYTDQRVLQEGHQAQDGEHQAVPVVEHAQDDDWVLVSSAGSTAAGHESDQTGNEENRETAAEVAAVEARLHNTGLARRRQGEAAVHQHQITPEIVRKSQNSVQKKAVSMSQKNVSRQKCLRQNQVREIHSAPKGRVNRKNKQMRPSGFRSSRIPQRSNVPRIA